jgi:thioester reductase-like protein
MSSDNVFFVSGGSGFIGTWVVFEVMFTLVLLLCVLRAAVGGKEMFYLL